MIQQSYAGRRRTSHKGGNRGEYRCALFLAPAYGDLSSYSTVGHDDQTPLSDEDIIQASLIEADTLEFSWRRQATNASLRRQGNSFPYRLGPMAVSVWCSAAHGTPRC